MEEYDNMYSIINLDFLKQFIESNIDEDEKYDITELFDIDEIYNPRKEKNCISVSLFAQNVNNVEPSMDCPDYKDKNSHWYNKYYKQLIQFIKDFNCLPFYNSYKIRLYLENQLLCFADELLSLSPRLEIYYMKHNSIGAQPGMLWRFMTFDDVELDIVFASDIDVCLDDHISNKLRPFIQSTKTLGRLHGYSHDYRIDKTDPDSPLNYAVCLGSMIAMRPKQLDICIKDIMIQYILYRRFRSKSEKPWEEFTDKDTERFNKPIGNHVNGWGGIWSMYGFDEKLFKHTIFPHLVKKGEVISWIPNEHEIIVNSCKPTYPYIIDYNFIKQYNNESVKMF